MVHSAVYIVYAAEDIMSIGESPEEMNGRLEEWKA